MATNGSGIRDAARVLGVSQKTVIETLKKSPATGQVLAYVLVSHEDEAFLQLNALLEPFGIMQFYRDGWGAYSSTDLSLDCRSRGQQQIYSTTICVAKPDSYKVEA